MAIEKGKTTLSSATAPAKKPETLGKTTLASTTAPAKKPTK